MATISKSWASSVQLVNAEAFDLTEEFSGDVDLETAGYEGAHVTCDVTFHASGTKNAVISIYGSLDGTNYDDIALFSQLIAVAAGAARQITLIVPDVAHFRVGFKTDADENDSYLPTITIYHQRWNWASA
jgi:hypothetical protein